MNSKRIASKLQTQCPIDHVIILLFAKKGVEEVILKRFFPKSNMINELVLRIFRCAQKRASKREIKSE